MTQEKLEEEKFAAYKKHWNEDHTQLVKSNFLNGFEEGAKWQAEKMYSEEDIMFSYEQGARLALISQSDLARVKGNFPNPKEWFETFKK